MTRHGRPRRQNVDAGNYSLQVDVGEDGSIGVAIVHVSPSRGSVTTTAYLYGSADAPSGLPLFRVSDAHDAVNHICIAAGGGTPRTGRHES